MDPMQKLPYVAPFMECLIIQTDSLMTNTSIDPAFEGFNPEIKW